MPNFDGNGPNKTGKSRRGFGSCSNSQRINNSNWNKTRTSSSKEDGNLPTKVTNGVSSGGFRKRGQKG